MGETAQRAIGYGRVSTEEQQKSGTSLVDQYAGNHRKAEQLGMPMAAYFEDADSGGFYLTRTGLQDALKYLEDGKANVLICKDFVRLTRNDRAEQSQIMKRIKDAGAQLIFWDVTYENSPLGEFSLNVTGDFAILERAVILDRTMRGRRAKVQSGIMTSRQAPYGYCIPTKADILRGTHPPEAEGKYLFDPVRAPIVQEIFRRYSEGQSLHGICRYLQESGAPKAGKGKVWNPVNLIMMFDNHAYYGRAAFGKTKMVTDETRRLRGLKCRNYKVPVPMDQWLWIDCPAIVTKQLWEACQVRRKENKQRLSTRPMYRCLLTGILRCPKCKRCMMGRKKITGYIGHYYACRQHTAGAKADRAICERKLHHAREVEPLIISAMQCAVNRPEAIASAYDAYHESLKNEVSQAEYERLRQELKDIAREEMNTAKAQIQGIAAGANVMVYETILRELAMRRTALQTRIDEFEKQRVTLRQPQERADAIAQVMQSLEVVLQAPLEEVSDGEKNGLLSAVIEDIYPTGEKSYAVHFREFDNDGAQLIIEVAPERTEVVSVIKRMPSK